MLGLAITRLDSDATVRPDVGLLEFCCVSLLLFLQQALTVRSRCRITSLVDYQILSMTLYESL